MIYVHTWTIGIPLPELPEEGDSAIRQSVMLTADTDQAGPLIERVAILSLIDWAENHAPHPEFPQYEGKSYLPVTLDTVDLTTDQVKERLRKLGCKLTHEVRIYTPPELDDE